MNASTKKIDNVVFDIGNVLVKWSPQEVMQRTFGDLPEVEELSRQIFQHETWISLNVGAMTEEEAKAIYIDALGLSRKQIDSFFYHIKDTQDLIDGSVNLLEKLAAAGYGLYALTDNIDEIVAYLKERYTFWKYFRHVTVSSEVHCMKPHPEIFHMMLSHNDLDPEQTVFIDDMSLNIEGAQSVGISTVQFTSAAQCASELKNLGLVF